MTVDAETHEVAPTHGRVPGQRALLRNVADATIPGPAHGLSERLDRARTEALEAEDGTKKRGLAGAAGPEHRDQLSRLQLEVEAAPQLMAAARERSGHDAKRKGGGGGHEPSAVLICVAMSVIHDT